MKQTTAVIKYMSLTYNDNLTLAMHVAMHYKNFFILSEMERDWN